MAASSIVILQRSGGGFLPSSISGLKLWLKADSLSLNDGDAVGTWADQSGNGNDATQGNPANKPTYKTAIQNGKPVVRFDGVNDLLTGALSASQSNDSLTLFVACNYTDTSVNTIFGLTDAGYIDAYISLEFVARGDISSSYVYKGDGSAFDGLQTGVSLAGTNILILSINSGTVSLYKNGGSNTDLSEAKVVSRSNYLVGARNGGASQVFKGDMLEILLYNGALSSTNRNLVRDYLNTKWAVY